MKFVELIDKVWNEGMRDAGSYRTHREILKLIATNAKADPEVDYDGTKWQLKFTDGDRGLMFEFSRLSSLVNMANLRDGEPGVICRATPSRLPQAFSWLYRSETEVIDA
jgi:hypothetical protein